MISGGKVALGLDVYPHRRQGLRRPLLLLFLYSLDTMKKKKKKKKEPSWAQQCGYIGGNNG
jgi:hypothetical protein